MNQRKSKPNCLKPWNIPSHNTPEHVAGKVATIIDVCPGKKRKVSGCLTSFLSMRRRPLQLVTKYLPLKSDMFLRMATPSREKYLKYKFHQLYPNIQHSEVIRAPFNHGRHWCLVVVNLEENFSVYLDSECFCMMALVQKWHYFLESITS